VRGRERERETLEKDSVPAAGLLACVVAFDAR